ncbi:DMT family transporter [Marinibacterium profundimaris]|uniref:Membrane protein n=1 Tax=Marinibacterium profundimaris TaxID=1679460 RepID=A0A225NFW6_9RHOB|nr:DMT family transporter [Marinibacterium profundimaris]OWU68710.1 membrane protein [Marinibacterium profundimaris]
MTSNFSGALLMMASMTAFTVNDAIVKLVGIDLPLMQILTLRGAISSLLLLGLALATGTLTFSFPRKDRWLIGARSLCEVAAAYFFLTALLNMPIANVSAVLQMLPLTVTAGAALFFGERVGWRRASAIALGVCGMLLIVRPGPEGFSIHSLYAVGAVACVTFRDLVVRRISPGVSSMSVSLVGALAVCLCSGVASVGVDWAPVTGRLWVMIFASSFCVMAGYLLSVMVMRVGEVSFVAPFRYTSLLVALILGLLVFGEWPAPLTLLGAGIVVASGLFTLYREKAVREGA